jgi:hypothetical protein
LYIFLKKANAYNGNYYESNKDKIFNVSWKESLYYDNDIQYKFGIGLRNKILLLFKEKKDLHNNEIKKQIAFSNIQHFCPVQEAATFKQKR